MLRVDQRAVCRDVEYAGASLDELRLDAELARNIGRQTGGPREVVSLDAVLDRDAHVGLREKTMIAETRHEALMRFTPCRPVPELVLPGGWSA